MIAGGVFSFPACSGAVVAERAGFSSAKPSIRGQKFEDWWVGFLSWKSLSNNPSLTGSILNSTFFVTPPLFLFRIIYRPIWFFAILSSPQSISFLFFESVTDLLLRAWYISYPKCERSEPFLMFSPLMIVLVSAALKKWSCHAFLEASPSCSQFLRF